MKLYALIALVLMAALMPHSAFAETTTLTGQPTVVGPQQQLPATARIWVDGSSMGLGGNWGIYSSGTLLNQLRDSAYASGKIGVNVAAGQVGQTVTHRCFITGTVEVGEEAKAGLIIIPRAGLSLGKDKLVGKACLTLTIYNVATGQVEAMVKAEGRADRTSASRTAVVIGRYGVAQAAAKENPESDLAQKAVAQAVSSLVQQLPTCSFILPAAVPAPMPVATQYRRGTTDKYGNNGRLDITTDEF